MHVAIHWPDEYNVKLWPFALNYATWLHNHIPRKDNHLSPLEIYCGVKQDCAYLCRAKVFGCPIYVLDPKLQNSKKFPNGNPSSFGSISWLLRRTFDNC